MTHATGARIGVLGCKGTTQDLLLGLARAGYTVAHLVTIGPALGASQQVADYADLLPLAADLNIPTTLAASYALSDEGDRHTIEALGLDLLLVMGWQRLVPGWWLDSLPRGAYGMHGSFRPLPHGRGRSPLNWSLLQGRDAFYTHLFRYETGIDDGPIVGMQRFDLNAHDTAATAHHKNTVAMLRLCQRHLPELLAGTATLTPQDPALDEPKWPKRTADDGIMHWGDTTEDLYNLVRAVTRPFPGAFTFLDDEPTRRLAIWRVQPFDSHLRWDEARPGQLLEVFHDGMLLVKTGDGTLLVTEWEGAPVGPADVGSTFGTLGAARRDPGPLPR